MHTHMLWRTRCQSEGTTINITSVEYCALQLLTQAREESQTQITGHRLSSYKFNVVEKSGLKGCLKIVMT